MGNLVKTWFLLMTLSIMFLVIGFFLGRQDGLTWGLSISLSINFLIYFWGDLHSTRLFPGEEIEGSDPWGVLQIVAQLSEKADIPPPRVFIVNKSPPQSMALGRSLSCGKIFLTQSLLEKLDKKSLKAVVAYHIAGIKRHDTFMHNVAGCLSSVFTITVILSPLGWVILKLCAKPQHYFQTDQLAASYLEDSKDLATTLWKINSYSQAQPLKIPWRLSPLFIVNPLTSQSWSRYFSFQPNVETRIKKLVGYFPI